MSSTLNPQSSLNSTSQTGLKPCQRSCRGLMLYFPPPPGQESSSAKKGASTWSWRSSEPVCLGLSTGLSGPGLDLQKLHEAREVPPEQHVDYSLVLGHSIYQTNAVQVLPPGCMLGIEVLRFSKAPETAAAASSSPKHSPSAVRGAASQEGASSSPRSPSPPPKTLAEALFSGDFRLLSSSSEMNARLSRTWSSMMGFDAQAYAEKLQVQAHKNLGSMSKWLRDLQNAVSKPKPE